MKNIFFALLFIFIFFGCQPPPEPIDFPMRRGSGYPIEMVLNPVDERTQLGFELSLYCREAVMVKRFGATFTWHGEPIAVSNLPIDAPFICDPADEPFAMLTPTLTGVTVNDMVRAGFEVRYDNGGYDVRQILIRQRRGWAFTENLFNNVLTAPPFTLADSEAIRLEITCGASSCESAEERSTTVWRIAAVCQEPVANLTMVELFVRDLNGRKGSSSDSDLLQCNSGAELLSDTHHLDDVPLGHALDIGLRVRFEDGGYEIAQTFLRTSDGWKLGAVSYDE